MTAKGLRNAQNRRFAQENKPAWLKAYTNQLDHANLYGVFLEGEHYGIVRCEGYSAWAGVGQGRRWEPTTYFLVAKKYDRSAMGKRVHTGKLIFGKDREWLHRLVKAADEQVVKESGGERATEPDRGTY